MTRAQHQSAHDEAVKTRDYARAKTTADPTHNHEWRQIAELADYERLRHLRAIQTIDRNARRHANRRNKEITK